MCCKKNKAYGRDHTLIVKDCHVNVRECKSCRLLMVILGLKFHQAPTRLYIVNDANFLNVIHHVWH